MPTAGGGRDNALESLQRGVFAHQNGDLVEAARLYKLVLRRQPNHFDALHLLGMLEGQRGRWDKAERLIRDALKQNDRIPEIWTNLGNVQHQRGSPADALSSFERALALRPADATALNNQGNALLALGRADEALASFEAALAAEPQFPGALQNRGAALRALGRANDALASFEAALALAPDAAALHADRGGALVALGRAPEALSAFDRALALNPNDADAHYNRGVAQLHLQRFADALESFDRALALAPGMAAAHGNRGNVLVQLGRVEEALACFDRAIAADPGFLTALAEKGEAAFSAGRYELAAETFERLVARNSEYPYALGNLLYARAHCCQWDAFGVLKSLVQEGLRAGRPTAFPGHILALADTPEENLRAAETWTRDVYAQSTSPRPQRPLAQHGKIRVAYVSANFHEHAMPILLAGLFERHDRSRFETFAFSFGADDGSAMRQRLLHAFDRFIDIRGSSNAEVAALMAEHEIDIAVDLMGFTQGARPDLFNLRPAPIQVSYMGYCGTTAMDALDYIVADRCVIPEADKSYYTEKVVHLPDSYFVNDDRRAFADTEVSRRAEGLPEHGFVFCCFNNNYKITPDVFALWMKLLGAVEGSVLWLLKPNAAAERNLRAAAAERGIAPERLVFAERVPPEVHLTRHRLADLFLDTLPYNAHTTACDALWAGVPVLTRIGQAFPGRVAASVLHAVGLPELVTETEADYLALALRLAREPDALAALRRKLADNRNAYPLFDTDRFRRHMEAAYLTMVERHRRGEAPESFAVEAIALPVR
jgi:protein O-GlcNAc transferase